LFGLTAATEANVADNAEAYTTSVEPWTDQERLAGEKITLGLYLTGHPIAQYEAEIRQFTSGSIAHMLSEVERSKGRMEARVAGLVVEIRTRQTKQGKTMGFATIDDRTGRLEIAAFGDKYETYRSIFSKDALLVAEGTVAIDDFSGNLRLSVETLYSMEQAREQFARGLQFSWKANGHALDTPDFIPGLQTTLQPFKGGACPVSIRYKSGKASANLQLGDAWRIHPTDELLGRLKQLSGVFGIEIKYR
jgi:DNA polymerase III subunit alpha